MSNKVDSYTQTDKKESVGVYYCRRFLEENNIEYKTEYRLDKYIKNRRFDFMFIYKNNNYILEFDGNQHFKSGFDDALSRQEIDKIKTIMQCYLDLL